MAESSTIAEVQTLLHEGNAALLAGNTYEALQRFRRATELDPTNSDAWVGLAGSVRPYREKREYLQQALTLDPANAEAQASLSYIEARLAAGEVLAPRGGSAHEPAVAPAPADDTPVETEQQHAPDDNGAGHQHIPGEGEAALRCIECGAPLADTRHMVWTPVGQLCADCARARRPPNYQVSSSNLAVAVAIPLILSALISLLLVLFLPGIGFFSLILAFLFAPMVAEFVVRILDRLTHAKRGRAMQVAVGAGIGLGAAPLLLLTFSLSLLLFTIVSITTAVARLR